MRVMSGNTKCKVAYFSGGSRLPTEFQEVEYIESTGTQYIDTGTLGNQDTKVVIKSQFLQNQTTQYPQLFGSRVSSTQNAFSIGGGTTFSSNFDNVSVVVVQPISFDNYIHTIILSKNGFFIDNVLSRTFENYTSFSTPSNLMIFALGTSGIAQFFSLAKLYSCQIYDNNVLVRNFIPCYRKADNVAGLYDLVNGVFYTNAGTGTFSKGSDVNIPVPSICAPKLAVNPSDIPVEYQEVEYIESSGTQYIDNEFIPNQDSRVITNIYVTQDGDNCFFGSRSSNNDNSFCLIKLNTGNKNFRSDYGTSVAQFSGNIDTWYQIDKNKNLTYLNGSLVATNNVETFTGYSLCIFARNNNGTINAYSYCKIKDFSIYDNNTLVRDYIPCYRKADNVIGLYDKVNGIFYTNAGTGNFTKGNNVYKII